MVFFNCNACGEALKKNQVEKHTYKCRQCNVLSCVDCGKDFWGYDYQSHTKCITENEKYCGKGYVAKVNKGEAKQDAWIEKVQIAIEQASTNNNGSLKALLVKLLDYPNIPRKKAKFENFLKNSLRIHNSYLISQVWDMLMASAATAATAATTTESTQQGSLQTRSVDSSANSNTKEESLEEENEVKKSLNKREKKEERQQKNKKEKKEKTHDHEGDEPLFKKKKKKKKHAEPKVEDIENEESTKKKKKKRKHNDSDGLEEKNESTSSSKKRKVMVNGGKEGGMENIEKKNILAQSDEETQSILTNGHLSQGEKFDWRLTIKTVLNKKGEMSYKKLRRKVLQEFAAQNSANYKDENLHIVFDKKIKKMKHVSISDGRASLTS